MANDFDVRYEIVAEYGRFVSAATNGIELDRLVRDALSRGWHVEIKVEGRDKWPPETLDTPSDPVMKDR